MRVLLALIVCVQAYLALGDCPSGTCTDDQTCCPGPIPGLYGCCPDPKAVCCSDGLHCCPANTVCDLAKGTCDDKKNQLVPFVFRKKEDPEPKVQSLLLNEAKQVEVVYCPGGTAYCPDGNTCCVLPNGQYGCCPYPSATCCNDRLHCCPYGSHCDATSQHCLQGDSKFPVAPKRPRTPATLIY